jgi:hypothetical protein
MCLEWDTELAIPGDSRVEYRFKGYETPRLEFLCNLVPEWNIKFYMPGPLGDFLGVVLD